MKAKLTERLTNLANDEYMPMLGLGYDNHGMMGFRSEGHRPGYVTDDSTSTVD
jgi:hypothetical protein